MNELALFAGAGGGILGGQLLGWKTVCAVEVDAFCARRLMQRQNEGHLSPFPIWDDVCTFDGHPWRGIVDVVSGGFPCQDISVAGGGAGLEGERSGLWVEMARIIDEVRPRFVFVENSPALTFRGLDRVLGDLASMGYDAEWGVLGASDVGAQHKRARIWILAHAELRRVSIGRRTEDVGKKSTNPRGISVDERPRLQKQEGKILADTEGKRARDVSKNKRQASGESNAYDNTSGSGRGDDRQKNRPIVANANSDGRCGVLREARQGEKGPQLRKDSDGESIGDGRKGPSFKNISDTYEQHDDCGGYGASKICGERQATSGLCNGKQDGNPWTIEPDVGRVVDGVAFRVDRLRAIGNGQVPQCHAEAWRRLLARV